MVDNVSAGGKIAVLARVLHAVFFNSIFASCDSSMTSVLVYAG